ncbi:tRNA preQ1(34) S-adenosylmethionine ribosyltransferase-isomerase QueA [Allopusillimonas ginsengisoli]|uniref:tRNA preQ1(34) S-adenosylmethionine ribosyltransferase-isomerase QueA n=1 Tax=Allopusillimonas ginsengisoli TaxID=453575 RepID=UPI0039C19835
MNPSLELSQFDYELPSELIAQSPAAHRVESRLLHLDPDSVLHDRQFIDLVELIRPGDLLVFNNTRVIKARLTGQKESGGKVEVLVERIVDPHNVLAHVRASKSPKPGTRLRLADAFMATVHGRQGELFEIEFPERVLDLLDRHGAIPLPPYITHAADQEDEERYQTIYASEPGAIAAPTAGLHFDEALLQRLADKGIQQAFVTLHVGAGTFQPVRVQKLTEHIMHAERYSVSAETISLVQATRKAGGRVIAVGTTSVRALEAAAAQQRAQALVTHSTMTAGPDVTVDKQSPSGTLTHAAPATIEGDTRLFITPGYTFAWVDALITNFHLPQSTLLMLVSALAGMEPIRRAYTHAVQSRYRFFSYGDAMFIESPQP